MQQNAPPPYSAEAGYPQPQGQPCYPPPQGQPGYPQPQGQPGYPAPQGQPQPGYNQPATVVVQPGIVIGGTVMFGQFPQNIVCPNCRANIVTALEYESGTLTWLIAGILFLIGWWLCCWIPCVIDGCKDVIHKCPNCHIIVGNYKRM